MKPWLMVFLVLASSIGAYFLGFSVGEYYCENSLGGATKPATVLWPSDTNCYELYLNPQSYIVLGLKRPCPPR